MKWIIIYIYAILFLSLGAKAQINIFFVPEAYGRTIDGLGVFKIQKFNAGSLPGYFLISVRENTSRSAIVSIKTPKIILNQGMIDFPRGLYTNSTFNFSPNPMASIVNQTRNLVPGEYTFCYKFIPDDKSLTDDFESCFDAAIQPIVPISLLIPENIDTICQKRPLLSWQPPMPFSASMKYRIMLTEKKQGEAIENLLTNMPLLYLDNINSNTLTYPAYIPELKEGHTYCWQAIAYQQGIIISRSEIWEFTVQCLEPLKALPIDSYREIKSMVNGNYYIAVGALRFSFQNNYSSKSLNYFITDLQGEKKKIKNLPTILIQPGLNKIDIELRDLDLKDGDNYLLHINPFNEPEISLRFVYKESTAD